MFYYRKEQTICDNCLLAAAVTLNKMYAALVFVLFVGVFNT